jgi:hypothetical protein
MSRPAYQDDRLLRTSDFVAEQEYHLAAHRRHNATDHVWGVAAGLTIVRLDGDLLVEPGSAVDGFGRDVVLGTARSLDLRGFDIRGVDAVDVWAVYTRTRIPATGDGVDVLVDAAEVEVTDAADIDPRMPPGVTAADLATAAAGSPPDDPARRWPVYLGRVTRDLSNPATPPIIEVDRSPGIGLVGTRVEAPRGGPWHGGPWLEFSAGADPSVSVTLPGPGGQGATPLVVSLEKGVVLNGRLTVDGDLEVRGGAVSVLPPQPSLDPLEEPVVPEWSVSHAEVGTAHELRVAMPPAGNEFVPGRLVVGAWRDGRFTPSLVVDEGGTVVVAGNLVVNGRVEASSVQPAQLSEQARLYLAGLQGISLLSLFQAVETPDIT